MRDEQWGILKQTGIRREIYWIFGAFLGSDRTLVFFYFLKNEYPGFAALLKLSLEEFRALKLHQQNSIESWDLSMGKNSS